MSNCNSQGSLNPTFSGFSVDPTRLTILLKLGICLIFLNFRALSGRGASILIIGELIFTRTLKAETNAGAACGPKTQR